MKYTCNETFERLQDYLDRELSEDETRLVDEHLSGCGVCAEEYEFEAMVLRQVQCRVQEPIAPADLFSKMQASLAAESSAA